MIGLLGATEIETVLRRRRIGRIACLRGDQPYIVPVTYGYDGSVVYVASGIGQKIEAMRAHPLVCFAVDELEGTPLWRTVVATGIYEEVTCPHERHAALAHIAPRWAELNIQVLKDADDLIVFRIRLLEKTGRYGREP